MPVYNAESFIKRAVDSILSQTFKSFELLIVDDGSTDNTPSISDEYAEKDKRIKVFHKENGGVASARQTGLENASGEFCIHFDADDYATSQMIAEMYATAISTNADVVIADYYYQTSEGSFFCSNQEFELKKSSDILIDILEGRLFGSLWNKLIRTSLYRDNGIIFTPGINYCEDILVLAKMFKDDNARIVHHPCAFYTYYCENNDSITMHYDMTKLKMRIMCLDELHNVLKDSKYKHALESFIWEVKIEAYHYGIIKLKDFEKVYHNSIDFIFHTNLTRKQRLIMMLSSAFNCCGLLLQKRNSIK